MWLADERSPRSKTQSSSPEPAPRHQETVRSIHLARDHRRPGRARPGMARQQHPDLLPASPCQGGFHVRLRVLAEPQPIFPQLVPAHRALVLRWATQLLVFQTSTPAARSRSVRAAHRLGVRAALDGVAGGDVVRRVELVKAVMAHARKPPAAARFLRPGGGRVHHPRDVEPCACAPSGSSGRNPKHGHAGYWPFSAEFGRLGWLRVPCPP